MDLSKWVGKRVKLTRKPPNSQLTFSGILQKRWTGHYDVKTDDGGSAMIFNGDTVEYNGKKIIVP